MSEDEAIRLARLGAVLLPSAEGARAVLDLPTGMLLVGERHHHTHGQIEEVERFAATLIAACWEARKARNLPLILAGMSERRNSRQGEVG